MVLPQLMNPQAPNAGANIGQKNDPPLAPSGPYLHGPGGLFNRRELDNPVMSMVMGPLMGVANALPVFNGARNLGNSDYGGRDTEYDTYITGVTAGDVDDFENQPTEPCQDGPTGGLKKICTLINPFGNYVGGTKEVQMERAGRLADRVDDFVLQLVNSPIMQGMFGVPDNTPSLSNAISNEIAERIFDSVVGFQRMFAPRVWIGSPANNSGERRDIVGLNTHINAGNKIDALAQAICRAADSDIKDFGFDVVGGNGRNIMEYIEMADRYVQWNARRQGFGRVDGDIAMRPELWQELTEIIPVQKYERVLSVINRVTNGRAIVNANSAYDDRNAMRESLLIPVNGRFIRVVEDDTIPELGPDDNAALIDGQYSSDIYFIPRTAMGIPLTFWEYFNHGNNQANTIQQLAGGSMTFTTDGGMFRWYVNFKNGCLTLKYVFTPRLRMRAPQLAWRIQNVTYSPLQHLRSWETASDYFHNGGVAEGTTQTYYSAWSPDAPAAI